MSFNDLMRSAAVLQNSNRKIFDATLRNAPNYTDIAVTGMNAKSSERQAAINAEAKVRSAGLRAMENVKRTDIKVDSEKEILDMKLDNFRKAGIIGALGTVAAGGVSAIQNNQAQKRAVEREAAEQRRFDARMAYLKESTANMPKPPEVTPFEEKPFEYNDKTSGTSSTSSSTSTSPSTSPSKGGAWNALSTVIRTVEGTLGDKGYTTRFGGAQFSDLSAHPNIAAPTPWGTKSEAAGAYQFMKPTWDEAKAALGLKDFSVESQERAGKFLTQRRGVQTDKAFTSFEEFASAITKLSPEWAGLPSSTKGRTGYHGQANADMNELWQIYQQNL